jgi:hypothetical protein
VLARGCQTSLYHLMFISRGLFTDLYSLPSYSHTLAETQGNQKFSQKSSIVLSMIIPVFFFLFLCASLLLMIALFFFWSRNNNNRHCLCTQCLIGVVGARDKSQEVRMGGRTSKQLSVSLTTSLRLPKVYSTAFFHEKQRPSR